MRFTVTAISALSALVRSVGTGVCLTAIATSGAAGQRTPREKRHRANGTLYEAGSNALQEKVSRLRRRASEPPPVGSMRTLFFGQTRGDGVAGVGALLVRHRLARGV